MKFEDKGNIIYKFSAANRPVAELTPGETVVVETADCFNGQIHSSQQSPAEIDKSQVNPATGPFYVTGAQPGDCLEVEIIEINVGPRGVMLVAPGMGRLGRLVDQAELKVFELADNTVSFSENITLPLQPMLGVVGVAPAEGEVPTHTPGPHGGNLDTAVIRPGARVHLPVFCPGGLLALGDVHGLMGDGEVGGTGLETSAEVKLRVQLHKEVAIPAPRVVTEKGAYLIHSAPGLDQAVDAACADALQYVQEATGSPPGQAAMLVSAACQLQICQVVNPLATVRIFVPRFD